MAARKPATEQLPDAFKEVDVLLAKEIDPLVVKFQKAQPKFFGDYQPARIIIDRPAASPGRNEKN